MIKMLYVLLLLAVLNCSQQSIMSVDNTEEGQTSKIYLPGESGIRSPQGGETYQYFDSLNIRWVIPGDSVTITISTDNNETMLHTTTVPNDKYYFWLVILPECGGDQCLVTIYNERDTLTSDIFKMHCRRPTSAP